MSDADERVTWFSQAWRASAALSPGILVGVVLAIPTIEVVSLLNNTVFKSVGLAEGSYEFSRDPETGMFLGFAGSVITLLVLVLGGAAVRLWFGRYVVVFLGGYVIVQARVLHNAIEQWFR